MDGAALDEAYNAVKTADTATMANDFSKAAAAHEEAAKYFGQAAEESPSNPARRVLVAMAEQQRNRAKYLASGRAREDAKKAAAAVVAVAPGQSQIASTITSQLAAARTPQIAQPAGPLTTTQLSMPGGLPSASPSSNTPMAFSSVSSLPGSVEGAFSALQAHAREIYARTYDQALPAARGTDPSESFYLVDTQATPKADFDARNVDLGAKVHALEAAYREQQLVLKVGLQQLQRRLAQREQEMLDAYTQENDRLRAANDRLNSQADKQEIERLRAENERLNSQVNKLKSRWDELKESAKKRSSAKS